MNIGVTSSITTIQRPETLGDAAAAQAPAGLGELARIADSADRSQMRETFDSWVGQTFYGQMLAEMRKTLGKPAYFHGGRGEEVFAKQLDQLLAEKMSEQHAASFSGSMFAQFELMSPSRR